MNISFSATTEQIRRHTKHCTRRVDKSRRLSKLKPGTILQGIEKGQGIKKGEHVIKLDKIVILYVNRESLNEICERPNRVIPVRIVDQYERKYHRWMNPWWGISECVLEGFADFYSPDLFVEKFCKINPNCTPDTKVTRILFDYVKEV